MDWGWGWGCADSYYYLFMSRLQRLREQYDVVIAMPGHGKMKRLLLEGILSELKSIPLSTFASSQLKEEQTTTFCSISHLSINSQDTTHSLHRGETVEQLQQRILDKQSIKIVLNEEIDNLEDDYFELQKVIHTKRKFCEKLEGKIVLASMSTSREVRTEEVQQKEGLSARLMNFFLF